MARQGLPIPFLESIDEVKMKRIWLVLLFLGVIIAGVYLWPVPRQTFEQVYAKAPAAQVESLRAFRAQNPPKSLNVGGTKWEYLATGQGNETILFLHGMTGSYDIWWQQIEAFKQDYRVVTVTYPAVDSLAEMEKGLFAILDQEGVTNFNVVGSSLGGYFTQYLLARHPERIQKAVLANTFPPNDLIEQKNGTIGSLIPYLPEWLVMKVMQGSFENSIYPASGNDEMTLAFLNEIIQGRMRKNQLAARYRCVVEKFDPLVNGETPILLIIAHLDPLVEPALQEQLRETYISAKVETVFNGHFPYIGTPDAYNQILRDFFGKN